MKALPALLIAFAIVLLPAVAKADGADADVLQRLLGKDGRQNVTVKKINNDAALRLTMNKDQIIRLNQDAASVIVNNPAHAEVLLDSPRLLIVMPRAPGATSFTVLNSAGDIILRRDIIVASTEPKYVRIRRMCNGNDASCIPAAYYYCPDGCYEVTPVGETASGGNVPPPANGAGGAASPSQPSAAPVPAAQTGGAGASGSGGAGGGDGAQPPQEDNHPVGNDGEPLTYPGQKP